FSSPPAVVEAWITAENVNDLIRDHGFAGEIDLFSLDMDGVDYWIWKALECIRPRVVVAEFSACWGPHQAMTIPYDPQFVANSAVSDEDGTSQYYFGASLPALVKLGREKGYRLVGCDRTGLNAFFVRSDLGREGLPEVSAEQCFELPRLRHYPWKN